MIVPITALYAALLVAVLVCLTTRIGLLRAKTRISILDGGNDRVAVEMRRHGNFAEHVPLILVLMAIVEINGGSPVFLHVVGIALVICRVAHPLGLHRDRVQAPLRLVGAVGTSLITIALGAMALWQGVVAI
ncbi:MAG: MAPEG family protein [Gammaproteobacteria bacterium]|nr:MAPEG family protein [Gammaproteobacteria bacterium]MDE0451701.1 MAPEG family protein [Gammaproteobacteria bacterium]